MDVHFFVLERIRNGDVGVAIARGMTDVADALDRAAPTLEALSERILVFAIIVSIANAAVLALLALLLFLLPINVIVKLLG
ncbi:hypothetical protein OC842_006128 [Tilletia horrida]|uniref:Uncharacterized protein n=1 Tax=Tilletia horrida TaxID=155126 RepID=A0AAN6GAW4_9BASI|nr:hypothetical protein OC842_006128 [Tilletia horrida]